MADQTPSTLTRTVVRYPGICEHPRTAEITLMGEARPHELCVVCGADWYGPIAGMSTVTWEMP